MTNRVTLTNATTETSSAIDLTWTVGGLTLYISDGGGGGVGTGTVAIERYRPATTDWVGYPDVTYASEGAHRIDAEVGSRWRINASGCDGVDVELVR